MWPGEAIQEAVEARLIVAISFHFIEGRIRFLADVLRSLSSFAVKSLKVVIYTNAAHIEQISILTRLASSVGLEVVVETVVGLDHPFNLTWSHKELIQSWYNDEDDHHTHFVYIEDDERFTWENFVYLLYARRELRPYGLLPGLMRNEWSELRGVFVSLDLTHEILLDNISYVKGAEWFYIEPDVPYSGGFILDREAAQEYISSTSFSREASVNIPWGVRERAAAGLTWEGVPKGHKSRIVVPIDIDTNIPITACRLAHLPNNYADNPATPCGKIAMDELVTGTLDPTRLIRHRV